MKSASAYTGWIVLSTLVLVPGIATGQTTEPPRVSVGAGGGIALPFHGDFDFTPWAWDADVRVRLSRHMLFEAAVGEWRHSETRVGENIPVTTPPGVIGALDQTTTRAQRTFEANALFTGGLGRVRVNAGGGLGLLQHDRRTRQVTTQCSPGVSCGSSASTFSNASGSAQAVGGIDVHIAAGFGLYGQARFIVPMTDPGGSDFRITTGVRWSLND